jgi:polyphosphate kinase 2 (PPK2 family)
MTANKPHAPDDPAPPWKEAYQQIRHTLPVAPVKLQKQFIFRDDRVLGILEGRNSAGKGHDLTRPDPAVVVSYSEPYVANGMIASRGAGPWSEA